MNIPCVLTLSCWFVMSWAFEPQVRVSGFVRQHGPITFVHENRQTIVESHEISLPKVVYNRFSTKILVNFTKPDRKPKYTCNPMARPLCAVVNQTQPADFCLTDPLYPTKQIKEAIDKDPLALKKYADVSDQNAESLVEHLATKNDQEFKYSNYTGRFYDMGNWIAATEGYICPSEVVYGRPMRAVNLKGQWRVIVQRVNYLTQTQRLETCLIPGGSCRALDPCHGSQCLQKYVYHRLLSFDPCNPQSGLFIDIYKFPSACSCHLKN